MPKLKPIGKLVDDCAVLTQKLVRLKAADKHGFCRCVTCGKRQHWKELQGGHFISRTYSKWNRADLDELKAYLRERVKELEANAM